MSAAGSSPAALFDLVVVGSGPAGHKAAVQGAKNGARVLLIERDRSVGGECVHRGTIPSKTLRESALFLAGLEERSHGLFKHEVDPRLEVRSLMQRLGEVLRAHEEFLADQLARNGVEVWHGEARFLSSREVEVLGTDRSRRHARGGFFLVATGSRPRTPPDVPVDHEHVLDSDSILSLVYLPESLVVLGAGVIACEFASIFAALGVHVTMIDQHERPLGFLEPELVEEFQAEFERRGGRFLGSRRHRSVEWDGVSEVIVTLEDGEQVRASKALVALGRTANLAGLGVEAAGLETTERGFLSVDENFRTNVSNIYAAGDVVGPPALAASSAAQGRIAVRHAFGLPLGADADAIPIGIYTIPEMSSVGLTEAQAIERHGTALVGRAPYSELARGLINGTRHGLLKLVADPSGHYVLGCQIVGEHATELIHLAQLALTAGLDVDTFVDQILNFPTLAEAYRVAALSIEGQRSLAHLRAV